MDNAPRDLPLGERRDRLARLLELQLVDLVARLEEAEVEALGDSFAALSSEIDRILAIDPGPVDPALQLGFAEWETERRGS